MNIRDILENPFLPVVMEIKENKKKFFKEWLIFVLCVGFSLFIFIFLARIAWFLPLIIL